MSECRIKKCVDGELIFEGTIYLTPGLDVLSCWMGSYITSNKGSGSVFSEGGKLMLSTETGEILEIGYVKI